MTLSCGRVGPFMSSFSFDVSLMSGIVDLGGGGGGGGGGGEKSISEHAVNVSGRCMVARQESSALLGCRKKVFENARQMWFLVAAHLSSCHGGCGHDDAPWSAACRCITKDFLMEGKELIMSEALSVSPGKLCKRIRKREFIDMAELLKDNAETERRRQGL